MCVGVGNIRRQASPIKMFVLNRNALVVRDRIIGEALHLAKPLIRRIDGDIIKGSVSIAAIVRGADILIEVVVGNEQVVPMIASIGNNQRVVGGDLTLKLQTEFCVPRAMEGVRS